MPRFRSSPSVSLCLAAGSHHAVSPKGMPVGIQAALTGLFHGALTAVGAANVLCHNASPILFRVRRAVCARMPDDVPGMLHSPHAGGSASFCTGNFRLFSFAPLRIPNCCFCNRPPFSAAGGKTAPLTIARISPTTRRPQPVQAVRL